MSKRIFNRDSRHLVRMSVRELEESQKMLCTFKLREPGPISLAQSTTDGSALIVSNDDEKIDMWAAKIEVFEVIRPIKGAEYRMRCLH